MQGAIIKNKTSAPKFKQNKREAVQDRRANSTAQYTNQNSLDERVGEEQQQGDHEDVNRRRLHEG